MNSALSLIRLFAGVAALWLIANTYQHIMAHHVRTALADNAPVFQDAPQFKPVEWNNCEPGDPDAMPACPLRTGAGAVPN